MTTPLYAAEKYTYRVLWSENDQQYVGVCSEFPELTSKGPAHDEALEGIISIVRIELETRRKAGTTIPDPAAIRLVGGRR